MQLEYSIRLHDNNIQTRANSKTNHLQIVWYTCSICSLIIEGKHFYFIFEIFPYLNHCQHNLRCAYFFECLVLVETMKQLDIIDHKDKMFKNNMLFNTFTATQHDIISHTFSKWREWITNVTCSPPNNPSI
jgi:hypothetical protein